MGCELSWNNDDCDCRSCVWRDIDHAETYLTNVTRMSRGEDLVDAVEMLLAAVKKLANRVP